jgi:hypothetical protein
MRFFVALNIMAEVRAITPSRSGFNRLMFVIISSVSPSLKYSSGSELRLSNGNTASNTFFSSQCPG